MKIVYILEFVGDNHKSEWHMEILFDGKKESCTIKTDEETARKIIEKGNLKSSVMDDHTGLIQYF